jgi:CubicO group peptidase (beta-lactamase class C family)
MFESTRQSLNRIVDHPQCPLASLSVAVVRGGATVFLHQAGRRWIDDLDPACSRPVDQNTVFRMASISKLITTIGALRLVEQGLLSLDADAGEFLGFTFRNPHFPDRMISLRMMLSHTSSMRDDAGYYWDAGRGISLRDAIVPGGSAFGEGRMWSDRAPPGEYFFYSNLPWGVVGTMMERVTGERFDRLMRRLVLDPLDIAGGFSPSDLPSSVRDNTATLYRRMTVIDGKEVWNAAGPWVPQTDDFVTQPPSIRAPVDYVPGTNGTLLGPQGNCRMSAEGLARIMSMLLAPSRPLLARSSIDEMFRTQWQFDCEKNNGNNGGEFLDNDRQAMNAWGLGVQKFLDLSGPAIGDRVIARGGVRPVGHMGDAYGLTSAMLFEPASGNGIVFLVGGVGFDPQTTPGSYSSFHKYEEQIMTALWDVI